MPDYKTVEDVIGATPDGSRSHKPELIEEALRRLALQLAKVASAG